LGKTTAKINFFANTLAYHSKVKSQTKRITAQGLKIGKTILGFFILNKFIFSHFLTKKLSNFPPTQNIRFQKQNWKRMKPTDI